MLETLQLDKSKSLWKQLQYFNGFNALDFIQLLLCHMLNLSGLQTSLAINN